MKCWSKKNNVVFVKRKFVGTHEYDGISANKLHVIYISKCTFLNLGMIKYN